MPHTECQNKMPEARLGGIALLCLRKIIRGLEYCPEKKEFDVQVAQMAKDLGITKEEAGLFYATLLCEEFNYEISEFCGV